jgi:hypothetical protein
MFATASIFVRLEVTLSMLLYNITVGVDPGIEREWLAWIKSTHVPDVMRTGLFTQSKIFKVLHDSDDGTISYSIQYMAKSMNDVEAYLERFAPAIMNAHRIKFLDKHVAFQTLLEEV